MRGELVREIEVNGQRLYVTRVLREGLAALATGPQIPPNVYPQVKPRTAYLYVWGLQRAGLVHRCRDQGAPGLAAYAITAQGRTVLAHLQPL